MDRQDRVTLDCREHPGSNCSLTIAGTESEVLDVAEYHVINAHGEKKEPGLREQLRGSLKHEAIAR